MDLEPGQRLSHYQLVEKIGEGGMGVVWKAVDVHLDREVALKMLPEAWVSDPRRLERFGREAKLLASLNHPRIASLYGLHEASSEAPGQASVRFLSMELIGGEDLAQRLTRGPLPLVEALRVALQVAEGLESAHERGIIHRDLKPANIKLTSGGEVKILDFGLAKALQDPGSGGPTELSHSPTLTAAATQAGVILGTAAYMSPEQSRGHEADRRTDVWAFGCVLYELLTGRGVFHGPTASDCIAGILGREPDWDALPPETPRAVRRLLRRCLQKDAHRRLHDIADARIEIDDALADDERSLDEPTAAPPRARAIGRHLASAAAGLIVGALAAALIAPDVGPGRSEPGSRSRSLSIFLPPGSPVVPEPQNSAVALSPDGSRLVYVGLSAEPDKPAVTDMEDVASGRSTQLFTRRIDGYEVTAIEGTAGATAPFFSPDGEWIGFVDADDGQLKKIRLRGGVPVALCSMDVRGPTWGADGRIYFGLGVGGLMTVSADGGTPEPLTVADAAHNEKTHRFPHLLPDGKSLLFTLGTAGISSYDDASVTLLDLHSGEYRVLFDGGTYPVYVATGHIVYGRDGTLEAVPFDLERQEVTGAPFTVAHGLVTSGGYGSAHYSVAPDGTLAYVPGGPERYRRSLYWLDRDGGVEELDLPPRRYGTAWFSPDGRRLALNTLGGNASIWTYDIERGTLTRLTTEWDSWNPIWTRNGRHVTFGSNLNGKNGLWQVAVDGGSPPEPLLLGERLGNPGSWSAGDRSLAYFYNNPETGFDIWLLSKGPGAEWTPEPLLQSDFQEEEPVFSPDGRWLAYTSDETGRPELYVRHFPIDGRKWRISAGGGGAPRWSPDGRELYYWKGNDVMAVTIATDPEFAPGKERHLPHPVFSHLRHWDISPDGRRFVIVGRVASDQESEAIPTSVSRRRRLGTEGDVREIRVVTDWFAELRGGG